MATQDISQLVVDVKSQGIQTAANQLDKLATSADKAEAAVKKLGTAVVGVNGMMTGGVAQTTALIAAMSSLTVVISQLSQSQARATVTSRANNEAMAEAHALARGLSGSLGALWVTYGNLAGMGVGIALGASLKGVIGVGKDVEQTLEGIRVLGGATTEEMVRMSAAINSLGTGVSGPREVAEALKTLTLAGLNADQSLKGVSAALNLAIGGEVSIEKSAETLVQVGTALGYTAESFDHVSDVIVKTAAASMSSVDSISGAFKSAAAVGTTYGASLQDIAVGLAAVANLGIQGTAAGTALKNLYKDLSASTQKVTNTLRDMKMNISSFRDSEGFMLPLVEVIQKLDAGMGKLNSEARNMAMVKMFGQQGLREGAALIAMLHQAADDTDKYGTTVDSTHNKLVELQDEIKNAAGTAALAAIAMAQTTENQFKSVKNTLQTTFSQVFTEIQPQIGAIARAMKEAFASDSFKEGLKTVISLVVDFTKVLVDNAAVLRDIAIGIAGAKFLEMANGIRTAAVAAGTFQAALGPLAVVIAGLTFAWTMYKAAKDRALSNKDAEGNLEDYVKQVQKETEKQVELYNLRIQYGSDEAAQHAQQVAERKRESNKAIADAKAGADKLLAVRDDYYAKLKSGEKAKVDAILALDEDGQKAALEKRKFFGQQGLFDNISNAVTAARAYADSQKNVAIQTERANNAVEAFERVAGLNADWSNAQAKKNRIVSTGDGTLSGKADTKGMNDKYAAQIQVYQNDIKDAMHELENFREAENEKFKAGQIGKLQLIDEIAAAEVKAYGKVATAAANQKNLADHTPNKTADSERFQGVIDKANDENAQAEVMKNAKRITAEREAQASLTSLKIKSLEEEGKYVQAAGLKWGTEGKIILDQVTAEAARSGGVWEQLRQQYETLRTNTMDTAQLKEDTLNFNNSLLELQTTLKGFKSDTYGVSISEVWDKAEDATTRYNSAMEDTKKKLAQLKKDAAKGTPEAIKAYDTANKEMLAVTDKQKTMWKEVGDTIANSLGKAFGSAGTALGNLYKSMLEIQNTENATAETRIGQYGDMAQAASGFFSTQSKGYKALNAIATVFHMAEMARTLVRTAASIAAGAAKFFEQSGWGGFAGVAAMGAVMAGLGYAMGGGSSHANPELDADYVQKHQGTGTVLGDSDAKSKSISAALDDIKGNSDITLPLTQAMVSSLQNIETSIKGLAVMAIQSGVNNGSNFNIQTGTISRTGQAGLSSFLMGTNAKGGAAGGALYGSMFGPLGTLAGALGGAIIGKVASLWGKTSQEITDSGLQFGGKVSDLESGKGIDQYAAVKTTKSSWFGLSKSSNSSLQTMGAGDDISRQFGLVFSNLEDSLKTAAGALGSSSDAVGQAIDNVVLQTTKISLKDLKGQDLTDAINTVLSASMDQIAKAAYPQMQAFQQVGEGYAQTVIRVATGVEQANLALEKLGVSAVNYADVTNKQGDVAFEIAKQSLLAQETVTREVQKSSVGTVLGNILGHFGESTTVLESSLTGIGDIIQNMSGSVDDLTAAYKSLSDIRKQMNLLGLNGNGLNLSMVKGAGGVSQLQTAVNTFQDKYFTDAEKSAIMLKSVTAEFGKLGVTLPNTRSALRAMVEQASKDNPLLAGQLLALTDSYDKLMGSVEDANKAQIDTMNDTIDGLKSFRDALKELKDSLALGDLSVLTPTEKYLEAKKQYEDTVSKAMAGDTTAQGKVSSIAQAYLEASRTVNASSQGYTDTYNQVMADIDKMGASTDAQLSNAEKQLAALQSQVSALDSLNATANSMKTDLDTLATTSAAPVTSAGTVSVDTKALEEKVAALTEQMATAQAATSKQIADLTEALYDATHKAAGVVATAVEGTATTTAYVSSTINKVNTTR